MIAGISDCKISEETKGDEETVINPFHLGLELASIKI
jgi:hypothetical protein